VLTGFFTGLTLIIAIGAQNAFVLRQGIRRDRVAAVVAVCAISDLVLILAGVAGIGALIESAAWVIDVVRWFGVAFLVGYGLLALKRALRPSGLEEAAAPAGRPVLTAVALTWLNPHVYLDTVILLGSIANSHSADGGRWWFAAGAAIASLVWFTVLGFGARAVAPLLARPMAWRVLDVLIGLTMLAIALKLALGG
jgi:L-lysine exporter family protein LysE/ArgO